MVKLTKASDYLRGTAGPAGRDGRNGIDGRNGMEGKAGPMGPAGPSGPSGLNGINGKDGSGFTWRGTYNPAKTYNPNDTVHFDGSSYICLKTTQGRNPLSRDFWNLVAQRGSNGGGGGLTSAAVISKHLGYADYNDASTASAPVTLVADTWTTLPNDGLGSFTNESYLPENVTTLLDAGGGIDISQLELGSDILVRPDFTVTPSANNSALFFRFSLGTGAGSYTLESSFGRLDLGAGIPYRHALQAMYIYAGDTNTRDNPVDLQIKLSGGGTVVNAGMAIKVLST